MNGGVFYPGLTHQIGGNTDGATARISTGTYVLAGGNNITLSQDANSVTIVGGAGGAGYAAGVSTGGNTLGDTGVVTGRLVLAGGDNITLSGSTNGGSITVTISGGAGGGGANYSAGASTGGNTAGDTGMASQRLVLVGGNNVTLSGATNGGSATLTISAFNQTAQSAIKGFGVSNTGQTAGNTGLSTGIDWVLAGSGSITLSQSTAGGGPNTVWVQHPAWLTTAMQSNAATISNIKVSAGANSANLSALTLSDSNGISFGLNGSTITASHNGLTSQSNQAASAANGSFAFQTLSFSNLNGISFGTSAGSAITASHNALTTARASTDAIGLNTAQSNVTWTVNSSGLSLDARGYAGTGTSATNASITLNSNGLAISVGAGGGGALSAGMSTAGNTSGDTGLVTGRLALVGGNNITLSGSTNAGSMSLTISAGNAAPSPVNFSAGTTSNDLGSVVFSNSNGISFGLNGSTITGSANTVALATTVYPVASANSVGTVTRWAAEDHRHAMDPVSIYEPYDAQGRSTVLVGVPTATSAAVSVYPFQIEEYVSAGAYNIPVSCAFLTVGTSSGRQTMGLAFGIYTRNASTLSSVASTSLSWQVTGQNSTYSINQVTTTNYTGYGATAQTTSAGSNISSGYTGMKIIAVPLNTLLTPGQYYLGVIGTNSTSSVNVGLSMSIMGAAMATGLSGMAPIGSFSSAYTSGQSPIGGRWNVGQGSWTSAGSVTMLPASMNMASVSAVGLTYPLIRFWST